MRGTLHGGAQSTGSLRFIPARAGNSVGHVVSSRVRSVHPRACGELPAVVTTSARSAGSSPRVRGTPRRGCQHAGRRRFIPARAGNSARWRPIDRKSAVHPRACGELNADMESRGEWTGSSPRVRGTRIDRARLRHGTRFIPARAGNSARDRTDGAIVGGSSPRVRGTPQHRQRGCARGRFIPARAGNSIKQAQNGTSSSVHPRACGELYETGVSWEAEFGSSPRGAGNS